MGVLLLLDLSNIWGLIHEKVKQHWGWAEKNRVALKYIWDIEIKYIWVLKVCISHFNEAKKI